MLLSQPTLGAQNTPTPLPLNETFVNLDITLNYPTGWTVMELAPQYLVIATSEDLILNMPQGAEPDTIDYAVGDVLIQLIVSADGEEVPEHPLDVLFNFAEESPALRGEILGDAAVQTINDVRVAKGQIAPKFMDSESNLYAFIRDDHYAVMRVTTALAYYEKNPIIETMFTGLRFNTLDDLGNGGAPSFTPTPANSSSESTPTPIAAVTSTPISMTISEATETVEPAEPTEPAVSADDEGVIRQWATSAEATSQYGDPQWSADQATGEPDTEICDDETTAWASSTPNGVDSLSVYFDQPVTPTQINIYQTYNPGAIISVELLPADGSDSIEIEDSADSGTDCPGIFTLDLDFDDIKAIDGVRINLDQTITGSWNEIDAVELVGLPRLTAEPTESAAGDSDELTQWASSAEATSSFGDISWSPDQATGEPDTDTCGDNGTAWASRSPTGEDSLTLYYDEAVFPTQINIYQTFNPGAIISVELLPTDGSDPIEIENSADSGTACPGIFTLDLDLDDTTPINGVRINLDQTITNNWNEIDAVELVGISVR
jgi:hypothetical protein